MGKLHYIIYFEYFLEKYECIFSVFSFKLIITQNWNIYADDNKFAIYLNDFF